MVTIQHVTKRYVIEGQTIKAVDDISIEVGNGEFLSIIGHSGSGKTTLLSLIGGLTKPDSGTITVGGKDIWSMEDDTLSEFRNKNISFIYQFSSLIPTLTVFENILLPTAFGKHGENSTAYALDLLEIVSLKDKMNVYPSQLSGGQQRRVAIARSFITNPELILADEPTGDLDEETEAEVMRFFTMMNEKKGVTFILSTHNTDIAKQTRRQMKMSNGTIKEL
ncbi:MAG: ABC transporter ATP-binding protein [Thermodesulfovibrionales bacterium]|jgi:putative ABC transport system ATP-binding protein/lipoprotein-releasing system ATP-binding protein